VEVVQDHDRECHDQDPGADVEHEEAQRQAPEGDVVDDVADGGDRVAKQGVVVVREPVGPLAGALGQLARRARAARWNRSMF